MKTIKRVASRIGAGAVMMAATAGAAFAQTTPTAPDYGTIASSARDQIYTSMGQYLPVVAVVLGVSVGARLTVSWLKRVAK